MDYTRWFLLTQERLGFRGGLANKNRKCLTGRIKSEILSRFRGGLCLQSFPPTPRRAFLSVVAPHSPQLLSFLLALIVAQTHGLRSLPRSRFRAASFRTSFEAKAARIALRPLAPTAGLLHPAAAHSVASRISGRTLLLSPALSLTVERRWSALPASLRFL